MKEKDQHTDHFPRLLNPEEINMLLKDAKETSAWMRTELKRRRSAISDDLTTEEKQ